MKRSDYDRIEAFMQCCMEDTAHDREHVYRVLALALEIAQTEPEADCDILIAACLLHDIGRKEQFLNPALCHAEVGAQKAERFLLENGFSPEYARRVGRCVRTHRFRSSGQPEAIEEKILFDADKLDAAGATGIARTLFYIGEVGQPLYTRGEDGAVLDGSGKELPSFFREYRRKLEKLYTGFLTKQGRSLAQKRRQAAQVFYGALLSEVPPSLENGASLLEAQLQNQI